MHKKRILIVGAGGFLGGRAARTARESFEVFTGSRNAATEAGSVGIDITDAESVDAAFRRVKPEAVLMLAAMSDIDRCEAKPEEAQAINVGGAENIANACVLFGARLLFTSSAAVFDGGKHGYTEEDVPSPVSVYGKTKARAEAAVMAILPSAVILRIALAIGFAGRAGTNAMMDQLAARWASGTTVASPTFESRNPIDAGTLSQWMLQLLRTEEATGIFHAGAEESISRYDLIVKLAQRMGYSCDLVQPQTAPTPGRAPRGKDHYLMTGRLQTVCKISIPSCDAVIERSFDEAA